jgi:hypothetical protein
MTTRNLEQQPLNNAAATKTAATPQHGRKCDADNAKLQEKLKEKRSYEPRQAH